MTSRSSQLSRNVVLGSLLLVATADAALAGIANSPLPTFSDNKASQVVMKVPGVVNRLGTSTVFFCSSLDNLAIDIGVEIFDEAGAVQNSVHAGVGAVVNVAPGATVTIATSATAAYLESAIVLPMAAVYNQGSARVVASSPNVHCNAMLVADATTPSTSLATLGEGIAPLAGALPTTKPLPVFSDSKPATSVVMFPGAVKKGQLETAIFCTSVSPTAVDIGVEILAPDGTVSNSIAAGNGAVLDVAAGHTVTFATTGTAALLEDSVITLPAVAQGVARVISTSSQILCSAVSLDSALTPPTAMSNLAGYGGNTTLSASTLPAALPSFSDGKPGIHVETVPGVMKRGNLQTLFLCSSLASSPIDIGVQIFALDGTLLNNVTADVGALIGVAPGATVTIATSTTVAYSESTVIPLSTGLQGVGRIVASSSAVSCTTMVVDDLSTPPTALAALGAGVRPGAGASPSTIPLPLFSNGHQSAYAAYFPGTVKRGNVETDIFCTSLASAPIDIGVQILNPDGTLANDVSTPTMTGAGNGALLNVAPGSTVTFGTTGTAALLESQVITLAGVSQGMARVVSNSDELLCSGVVLDAALNPPTSMTALQGFGASCGDGIVQGGEQCDGSNAAACPGNCGGDCLCPAMCGDGFVQAGEQCDDHNALAGDCCSATCQLECNDGNACTQDSCNPSGGACTNAATPALTCLAPTKTSFQLKKGITDSKDKLKWIWSGGPFVLQGNFGYPDATTSYSLCLYDSTGNVASLAADLELPPSPLWVNADPKGWTYADKLGSLDGVTSVKLVAGSAGASKVQVRATGANIPMPTPFSASKFFNQQSSVTLQLRNDETGVCWGSTFSASLANDAAQFKAKAP